MTTERIRLGAEAVALSNAERQRRYRSRRKEMARAGERYLRILSHYLEGGQRFLALQQNHELVQRAMAQFRKTYTVKHLRDAILLAGQHKAKAIYVQLQKESRLK